MSNYASETTETTLERAVTYVCARCRKAGKPHARQVLYSLHLLRTQTWGITGLRSTTRETWAREGIALPYPHPMGCAECGKEMSATIVRGRYSADHKCGARCRNAKGGDCECECGGANHGAGFRA